MTVSRRPSSVLITCLVNTKRVEMDNIGLISRKQKKFIGAMTDRYVEFDQVHGTSTGRSNRF